MIKFKPFVQMFEAIIYISRKNDEIFTDIKLESIKISKM